METEFCFICAVKLGRGNRSEIGRQEKMDKLVSVSHTVEHSSTIISDILSRILNETVMREESVCRICFNLLNDIDYHLKEAQEKTDEITAKFLDKEKDRQIQDLPRIVTKAAKKSKVVTNSGARPGSNNSSLVSRTIQTDRGPDEASFRTRSPSHVPVRGGGKGQSFFRRADNGIVYNTTASGKQPASGQVRVKGERSKRRPSVDEAGVDNQQLERRVNSSPEVSSVSPGLAEKKRKLLSRVLGSGRKKKVESEESEEEEENRLTIDIMEERGREEKKERKRRDKKRRRKERSLRKERERRERRANMVQSQAITKKEQQEEDRLSPDSDLDYSPPTSPGQQGSHQGQAHQIPSPRKAADIRTVDLAQLGDLFSVSAAPSEAMVTMVPQHQVVTHTITLPHPPVTSGNIITVHPTPTSIPHQENQKVFAKKSFPVVPQQGRSHVVPLTQVDVPPPGTPIYLLPEGVTAVNVQQAEIQQFASEREGFPIIDCQPLLNHQVAGGQQAISVTELTEVEDSDEDYLPPAEQEQKQEVVMKTFVPKQETTTPQRKSGVPPIVPAAALDENPSPEKKNPGTPSIPCPQCDKMFMRGYNMRVHIDRVHNKHKPWQCQFCEKSFATTSDLKQHLSSHGMGKIHKCEDCGREFTNRDSAILHRKQHNNERTHFCNECGKGFFKASCLQRHVRSHTGEKPYSCEYCKRGFSQVTTVKNHKKVCKAAVAAEQGQHGHQVQAEVKPTMS